MKIEYALMELKHIIGIDLSDLAEDYGITIFKNNIQNKGWAGQTIEKFLGIPINKIGHQIPML